MSGSSDTFTASARLATGDWVVLRRPDQGPLGFLGKVTDGEWDPRDDALLRARVDTTASKPVWLAAGDLERVEPTDEAGLVEAALLEGLVPADRAVQLRTDLAALRAGTLTYVRSPGLLDRLWAALPTDPAQRTGGLAAFFDEGRRALHDARNKRWAPAPVASPVKRDEDRLPDHFVLDERFEIEVPEAWLTEQVAATRATSSRAAVGRVLLGLPRWSLSGVVVRLGKPELRLEPANTIRATLLEQGLTLEELLGGLSPYMIRSVPPLLGLPELKGLPDPVVAAWVVAAFRDLSDTEPALVAAPARALAPLPPWSPPLVPVSEAEAKWRLLCLVRARKLPDVCARFGDVMAPRSAPAHETCLAIARSDRGLRQLLLALPHRCFPDHAPWVLGLELGGTREAIIEEILRRYPPMAMPALRPSRAPDELLLPHVARALTRAELILVLLGLGSDAPVDPDGLVAGLRRDGHGVRDVLSHLGPGALRRVATACGVPESLEAPEQLHAAILSFEPSPFA